VTGNYQIENKLPKYLNSSKCNCPGGIVQGVNVQGGLSGSNCPDRFLFIAKSTLRRNFFYTLFSALEF
jgi:hypothetical protein